MFSIQKKLFLALKKVWIIKIFPPQVPLTQSPSKKISPHSKISDSSPTPYYYLENPVYILYIQGAIHNFFEEEGGRWYEEVFTTKIKLSIKKRWGSV